MVKKTLKLKKIHEKTDAYKTEMEVMEAYKKFPKQIKNILKIEENYYKVKVVKNLHHKGKSCAGMITTTIDENELVVVDRCIFIKERSKYEKYQFAGDAFYHECGHVLVIEAVNNRMMTDEEFNFEFHEAFFKEREYFIAYGNENDKYFRNSNFEYFAQSFSEYFLRPERLKENTPKTYGFMDKFVNEILNRQ